MDEQRRLSSLLTCYEHALAELHAIGAPELDALIARLEARQAELLEKGPAVPAPEKTPPERGSPASYGRGAGI